METFCNMFCRAGALITTLCLMTGCYSGAATSAQDKSTENPLRPAQSSVPDELLERVKADAAQRTGAKAQELSIVSAESVTWANGALGCPEPGRMYTQALVPGYRIRVRAGGEELDYHTGPGDQFLVCPRERAQNPIPQDSAA